MTKLPTGFEIRGVYFYCDPNDPYTFFYIPGEPTAEVSPSGQPSLSLMVSDQIALLQLGSRWGLDAQQQEAIEQDLQHQFSELTPALIRLSPAPVTIKQTVLQLGDGDGNFGLLQTVSSAGYPPFAALFNVQLTSKQKTQAIAALNGRENFLVVTYQGTLATEIPVSTSIQGDIRTDLAMLNQNTTLADCLEQIELAISANRLIVQRSHPETVDSELVLKVDQIAKYKAASVLLDQLQQAQRDPDRATLEVTATLIATQLLTIERSTDISTWFEGNTGLDHVRVLPPVSKEPEQTSSESLTVRLGFDAQDSAIAFIQVKFGEAQATLRPPKFDTVTFSSVQSSSSLMITTHYTDGGSSWENQLPFPQAAELSLNPNDVGLALIVVDASARKQAGSTSLQIQVKYIPKNSGTEDERTLYFRFGEWTDSWYIVTRSTDLGGVLEFEAKETTLDDVVIKHPLTTTTETEIKL